MSLARQGHSTEAVQLCVDAAKADKSVQPALTVASALVAGKPGKDDYALAEPILAQALQEHKDDAAASLGGRDGASRSGKNRGSGRHVQRRAAARAERRPGPEQSGQHPGRRSRIEGPRRSKPLSKRSASPGPRANLLDTKGTILVRDGKAAQACPLLEKAVSTSRSDPRYHLHLAEAYLQLGEREKAKASFSRARDTNLTSQILTPSDQKAIEELQKAMVP